MDKKCITRLTAQTIHFLSITQPENNLSVSINFCRCFLTGSLYIQSFSFVLCGYPQITLRAVPAFVILPKVTTLPQIKSGENQEKRKTPARDSCDYHLKLVRLKKFVKVSECTGFCVDT